MVKVCEKLGMWVRQESKFRVKASRENMVIALEVVVIKHFPQFALLLFQHHQGETSRFMHYSTLVNNHILK